MTRTALILLGTATLMLVGCDSISTTRILIAPALREGTMPAKDDVLEIVSPLATQFQLEKFDRNEAITSFASTQIGRNPNISLVVEHSPNLLVTIEIEEMFIAHPTEKHRQLAEALIQRINANGYRTTLLYQTAEASTPIWPYLIGVSTLLGFVALVVLQYIRTRNLHTSAT